MDDPQITWNDYFDRKKQERLREASKLWGQIRAAGVTDDTVLALDFVFFGNSTTAIEGLSVQLSEHYEMSAPKPASDEGYWLLEGTTRPYGVTLTEQTHSEWVAFMADVARSHGCVFSTWVVEAPSLKVRWNSEIVDGA